VAGARVTKPRKPKPRKPKSRGGPDSPESARRAKVVSLRLEVDTIAALDAQAATAGLSRGAYVTRLVAEKSESPTRPP
jgi:hypothetical protein